MSTRITVTARWADGSVDVDTFTSARDAFEVERSARAEGAVSVETTHEIVMGL